MHESFPCSGEWFTESNDKGLTNASKRQLRLELTRQIYINLLGTPSKYGIRRGFKRNLTLWAAAQFGNHPGTTKLSS
jgi:hypothetical protein